ncbi:EVE domain-containing protein [Cylindrospermum sp. FACHB-282]|uniref:EVE domain-containing protein n=1 Tax=Cylindrospermum sp. FACHB-282 TaxID=2692794 RepID=UPI00168357FB|nr:EVE domain-containing protein [Cylindrospermum sp. FACHB-282]MBD2386713.1 EVE domain-containing protein [Cylindrospermum sp. FACHB-282]
MAYWLLKTEPADYSYFDLEREGSTVWDGVNNPLALKYLRTMLLHDLALIYHTGKERQVMGVAEIISQPYADPALNDSKRVVVDLRAVQRVTQPVTLVQIKQDGKFTNFELLRLPRLSVVPVSEFYWQRLIELAAINLPKISK